MTYESFVSGLKNKKGDLNELKRLKEKIRDLEYLECGVSSYDFTKVRGTSDPSIVAQIRLDKIDEINDLIEEANMLEAHIKIIDKILYKQEEDVITILKEIYYENNKKVDVAKKYNFSSDVEMERYLKRSYL